MHGPAHEAIRRKYIELRYQLLPYLYTAVEESTRTGIPLMRPLFLEYPQVAQEAMKAAETVANMSLPSVLAAKEAVNRAFESGWGIRQVLSCSNKSNASGTSC